MIAHAMGERFEGKNTSYPNVYDGLEGVRFIEKCVESSRQNGEWLNSN